MSIIVDQGILGIVTGILTTTFLYAFKVFWSTTITPYLKSIQYQGVKVDGQWYGSDQNQDSEKGQVFESESNLILTQNAHALAGSFTLSYVDAEKSFSLAFNVTGYMWEGYITLNFVPKDKRVTSYATTLLKLHDGGQLLLGSLLYRDVGEEQVGHLTLALARKEQTLPEYKGHKASEVIQK